MTRTALVTGANRGIGRQTALQLARLDFTVLLGSRDPARGQAAAAQLRAEGVDVTPVELDVADENNVDALAARILAAHGSLDALVNNAGVFVGAAAVETTRAHMSPIFDVNVFGAVNTIHALLPLLIRSAAPRIVNVSSTTASLTLTSAGVDLPGDARVRMAYASSKAALNMLTIQYAKAFAEDPKLAHLKINAATPGYTATDMNGFRGTRSAAEAARVVVRLATLPDDGPSGGFFGEEGPIAW